NGLIWTYQLALPALLYAINARLAVLQSFYPDFRTINQIYRNEIYDWIAFLKNKVLPKLNHAIWVEEAKDWHTFSSYNKRSHYCCNIYTGEFVTGDADKDAKFIQQNGYYPVTPALNFFLGQRFLALYTPLVSGVLATIASLYQLASLTPYIWHDWQDLGGEVRGEVGRIGAVAPGAVAPGGDVIDLYVRGTDDFLYEKYFANGKWTDWFLLDSSMKLASAPVAVSNDINHRAIYVHGADDTAAPVAVCARKLHRGIFVTGWDGKAYHKYWGE
nr:hypothetical protein [Tanacetum cinerariifolium]